MKKVLLLLICLLALSLASTAMADYMPGDTVTITVSITNPSGSTSGSVLVKASDSSALVFQSASLTMGGLYFGIAPPRDGGSFGLMMDPSVAEPEPVPSGVVGTVTYKVADSAKPGTYSISVTGKFANASGGTTVKVLCAEGADVWDEGVETTPATCEGPGVMTYTCTVCGKTRTEEIPQRDHFRYQWVWKDGEPTCTEGGIKVWSCWCGVDMGEEEIAALGHDMTGEWTQTSAPTCEGEGVETLYCKREGCSHSETRSVAPLGHNKDESRYETEPTCTEDGLYILFCSRCGETQEKTVVPALGHDMPEEWTVEVPAACEQPGSEIRSCRREGCDHTERQEIPALEHNRDRVETIDSTCTVAGSISYYCTLCGELQETVTLDLLPHTEGDPVITKQPTCTETGLKSYKCTVCGAEIKDEVIPALGHDWKESGAVEPTCTETGLTARKECARCGDVIESEEIPALGHDIVVDAAVAPTCTKTGLTEGSHCDRCGYVEVAQQVIDALGHDYDDGVVTKEPTCTKTGIKTFTCSRCGDSYTEKLDALGHDYDDGVVTKEPTCTGKGTIKYTCNRCGRSYTESLPALGHDWDEGTVTKEPTCTKTGVLTYTCLNNPAHTKTEVIPALGHTPGENVVIVPPTCTKPGSASYVCTVCGASISSEKIPATGHSYDDGVVTKAPTCTTKGVMTYTCQNEGCGHTYTKAIPATGHNYDDGVVTTEPTCTTKGVMTFTCQNEGCGKSYTKPIAATGHNYDEGVVTKEPTCTEGGVITYTCQNDPSHTKTQNLKKLGHDWSDWEIVKVATEEEDGLKRRTCQRCGAVEEKIISRHMDYRMNVCTKGIRLRDMDNLNSDDWYMFTPIDLSVDGEQVIEMIAGNTHVIGEVKVLVEAGNVTFTYELYNKSEVHMYEEFLTILPSAADLAAIDFDTMTNYAFGEAVSIQNQLGGDTKVLLMMRNRALYEKNISGIYRFKDDKAYDAYVEELKALMD